MIHRSPLPDVEIPEVSLSALLLGRAREYGQRTALIDGLTGDRMTFAELAAAVERAAAWLADRGFGRGDVAALCAANCLEFPIAFLAVARLGGATTTVNPNLTAEEIAKQLADARPAIVLAGPGAEGKLPQAIPLRELRDAPAAAAPPEPAIEPAEDVVALPYSSGTTGVPKGVMLTHRNLVAMLHQLEPLCDPRPDEVSIAVLPFFHIYGLVVILLLSLFRGGTLVVLPRFEMESFLEAIERHRVTRLPLVPPLVLRLAREPAVDRHDLSSVRVVVSGAAPLAPELAEELGRRLGCPVTQGYGMTEISPGGHMHPQDGSRHPPGSVGILHPNTECRIVDPATGEDVAEGEVGEVWYRGPQVMKGYLGRPEATAEMILPGGWLRTGDLGRVDPDGYLYVVDRLKELIKYKGYQVAPAELEALLLTHPAVADAAVVGAVDAEAGEIPMAFVVLRQGAAATADDLMEYVAGRVASYKRVRAVRFLDEIPKSPSGKILRRVLKMSAEHA